MRRARRRAGNFHSVQKKKKKRKKTDSKYYYVMLKRIWAVGKSIPLLLITHEFILGFVPGPIDNGSSPGQSAVVIRTKIPAGLKVESNLLSLSTWKLHNSDAIIFQNPYTGLPTYGSVEALPGEFRPDTGHALRSGQLWVTSPARKFGGNSFEGPLPSEMVLGKPLFSFALSWSGK